MTDHTPESLEMTRIHQRDGKVTTTAVLAEAKNKDHIFHSRFEWDNKKASHEYRLIQARRLIKVTPVIVEEKKEQLIHVPRIVHEEKGKEGFYQTAGIIAQSIDQFVRARDEAISRLNAAKRTVEALETAASKEDRGDDVMPRIMAALKSIEAATEALKPLH